MISIEELLSIYRLSQRHSWERTDTVHLCIESLVTGDVRVDRSRPTIIMTVGQFPVHLCSTRGRNSCCGGKGPPNIIVQLYIMRNGVRHLSGDCSWSVQQFNNYCCRLVPTLFHTNYNVFRKSLEVNKYNDHTSLNIY